jgi:hypothetical protein
LLYLTSSEARVFGRMGSPLALADTPASKGAGYNVSDLHNYARR